MLFSSNQGTETTLWVRYCFCFRAVAHGSDGDVRKQADLGSYGHSRRRRALGGLGTSVAFAFCFIFPLSVALWYVLETTMTQQSLGVKTGLWFRHLGENSSNFKANLGHRQMLPF